MSRTDDVAARLRACAAVLKPVTKRGIHMRRYLNLGVATSIGAAQERVVRIDASLVEIGKRKMVGGQERMITDVALDMVKGKAA